VSKKKLQAEIEEELQPIRVTVQPEPGAGEPHADALHALDALEAALRRIPTLHADLKRRNLWDPLGPSLGLVRTMIVNNHRAHT
jgi:hypothetical protein